MTVEPTKEELLHAFAEFKTTKVFGNLLHHAGGPDVIGVVWGIFVEGYKAARRKDAAIANKSSAR